MPTRSQQRELTCGTLFYELLKNLLCTFEIALLAERLASAERGLVVLRISRKRFLRRLLRTFPILALDVTRRHIRVNLLDELICLSDARWGDEQHTAFKNLRAIWSVMDRTSVRSFGAAAASIAPEFIAEATAPPDLQKQEVGPVRCGTMRVQGVWHRLIQAFSIE